MSHALIKIGIILIVLVTLHLAGCGGDDSNPPTLSAPPSRTPDPQIPAAAAPGPAAAAPGNKVPYRLLTEEAVLTHDAVHVGTPDEFHVFKYDFDPAIGSYGLLSLGTSTSYALHKYAGKGFWDSVEDKVARDPTLQQIKVELTQKLGEGKIKMETVPYGRKG